MAFMPEVLDIRERGAVKDGQPQLADQRLWMQISIFRGCKNPQAATQALEKAGVEAVLYESLADPAEIGVLSMSEDPETFLGALRVVFRGPVFAEFEYRPDASMIGRTYSLGHEPDLQDWLLAKPRRTVFNPDWPWAVWYPLRRAGGFNALPSEEQVPILREHGKIGHAFGESDLAHDVRLACFGVDRNDNDFVIGLVGKDLYPLSRCVQDMRKTRQTSQFIQNMGPFFVGRVVWRSKKRH